VLNGGPRRDAAGSDCNPATAWLVRDTLIEKRPMALPLPAKLTAVVATMTVAASAACGLLARHRRHASRGNAGPRRRQACRSSDPTR
jgi:hypothetical protein